MDDINYLYEDDKIIVCAKPSGMATESARIGNMDLVNAVRNHIARSEKNKGRQGKNLPPYIALINRLDQPVEGIVLLAKDKKAAANLSTQLREHEISKRYLAVVCGKPKEDSAKLINYLSRNSQGNAIIVENDSADAKKAVLNYECLKSVEELSLIKVELETGRFHQIRAQLSNIGCPIYGDNRYGCNMTGKAIMGFGEIALCSYQLEFKHPATNKDMSFIIRPSGDIFSKYFTEEIRAFGE